MDRASNSSRRLRASCPAATSVQALRVRSRALARVVAWQTVHRRRADRRPRLVDGTGLAGDRRCWRRWRVAVGLLVPSQRQARPELRSVEARRTISPPRLEYSVGFPRMRSDFLESLRPLSCFRTDHFSATAFSPPSALQTRRRSAELVTVALPRHCIPVAIAQPKWCQEPAVAVPAKRRWPCRSSGPAAPSSS